MSEKRLTPEEMFDEHSDCTYETDDNVFKKAMTKEMFCDIYEESERQLKTALELLKEMDEEFYPVVDSRNEMAQCDVKDRVKTFLKSLTV